MALFKLMIEVELETGKWIRFLQAGVTKKHCYRSSNDALGQDVAVAGDVVVAGVPNDDDAGTSSGAAYVFEVR